jgi:ribosomal protein L11 methyltransferase
MSPSPKLWSVSVTAKPLHIDAFAAAIDADALSLSAFAKPRGKTAKAEALYGSPPNAAVFTARLAVAAAMLKVRAPKPIIREIPNLDWLEKVAGDFPPLPIAHWTIHGARHKNAIANPRYALQIDATSAFGTGEHPTTRGCLILLDKHLKITSPHYMLDMGCGSGILAMACAKTSACTAIGIDLDPQSVGTAKDNIAKNGLRMRVAIARGNGYNANLVRRYAPYNLIMANIFARPLAHMAKDLKRNLRPGGLVILAGLLTSQANLVLSAHRAQGLYLRRRLKIGEWTILALKRRQ